jgi:hypothetical protein
MSGHWFIICVPSQANKTNSCLIPNRIEGSFFRLCQGTEDVLDTFNPTLPEFRWRER